MARPNTSRVSPFSTGFRVLMAGAVLGFAGCDGDTKDCDEAALVKLVADAPADVAAGEAEDKERARVSAGLRAACPATPQWMAAQLKQGYEGAVTGPSERAEWLLSDEAEEARKEAAPWRERVCPKFGDVVAGMSTPVVARPQRPKYFWEECNLAQHGLYTKLPEVGERAPLDVFDFSVFLFLKDSGVKQETAVAVVRGLGATMVAAEPDADE